MITLTVNPDQEHKEYSFSYDKVSIGSAPTSQTTLTLKEQIQETHLTIVKEGSHYYTYNVANDPFVTLNDIPYGKRRIKHGDILQIGKTVIAFTVKNEASTEAPTLSSTEELHPLLDKKINASDSFLEELSRISDISSEDKKTTPPQPHSVDGEIDNTLEQINQYLETLPSEQEIITPKEKPTPDSGDESQEIDIESLVKEVEKLDIPEEPSSETNKEEENLIIPSLDENETNSNTESEKPSPSRSSSDTEPTKALAPTAKKTSKNPQEEIIPSHFMLPQDDPKPKKSKSSSKTIKYKMWVALFIILVSTASLVFNGVYSRLQKVSTKSEVEAAREVSDIALALTYAQINHIQPQRQNWTDPIFLTNSIRAVLSGHHKPYGTIDNHGRIIDGKYLLRIYNNRDMTRFIVIAQPEASLTQWLAPQKAIVIDSKNMVLHRIKDLRPLNRLLVNLNSLSGESGKALNELIKAEEIVQLSTLSNKHNQNGFSPPQQLDLMKMGAENYVYNAPRYSQIGENIMETAIDLVSRPGSSAELKKLEEDAKLVSRLPDAVMYTSKGMKTALKAQKALTTLLPEQTFYIGYLQIDDQGNMKGSHLIFDLEAPKRRQNQGSQHIQDINSQQSTGVGGYQPLVLAANASEYLQPHPQHNNQEKSFHPSVDVESPLYLQIVSLARERQDQLQALSKQIIDLIHKNNTEYVDNFSVEIQRLLQEYQQESHNLNRQVVTKLEELYHEYDFMPMSEFSEYVKAAGLSQLAKLHLKQVSTTQKTSSFKETNFDNILMRINRARTFEELHNHVAASSKELRLENIPDTGKLITYQNRLRTQVLQTLNEMLLSPDRHLPAEEISTENRMRLSQILIYSWVSDPEEQNFYLNEYDNLREMGTPHK
jgi:hypothetical protein